MMIRPDGTAKQQLTHTGVNYAAAFSSDGKNLVYVSSLKGNTELFSLNLESREAKRLTDNPTRDNGADWFIPKTRGKIVFKSWLRSSLSTLDPGGQGGWGSPLGGNMWNEV